MERAISAGEANGSFSEMLRDVQSGDSFVVTSQGEAIARLIPVERVLPGQSDRIGRLLDYVKTLPRRPAMRWKREDLYDRRDRED